MNFDPNLQEAMRKAAEAQEAAKRELEADIERDAMLAAQEAARRERPLDLSRLQARLDALGQPMPRDIEGQRDAWAKWFEQSRD